MKNILIILLIIFNIILLQRDFKANNLPVINDLPRVGVGGAPPLIDESSSVVDIVNYATPSVVTIALSAEIPTRRGSRLIEGNIGSGFVLSKDGYIATNSHVVSLDPANYTVIINNQQYKVEKIFKDANNDLAILKINADNLSPLHLGDSSKLKLGESVIAIGTPLGEFSNSVTTGVVSGVERTINAEAQFGSDEISLKNLIQTDAAINPGNSGGPLINAHGQVIGINTAIVGGAENIGFSIPVNALKQFATQTPLSL